ncbi:MAG: tetratricopeptide repeat protein, partial [bacterium]|nr:tetratricopeptide repeat protein [bacterium]
MRRSLACLFILVLAWGSVAGAETPSAESLYRQGVALAAEGRGKDARKAFEAAVAADPSHVQALFSLGVLNDREGRLPEAEAAYRRAVKADPSLARGYVNLGS